MSFHYDYEKLEYFDEDGFFEWINKCVRRDVSNMLSGDIQQLYSEVTIFGSREKLKWYINNFIERKNIQNKEEFLKEAKEKIEEAMEICFKKALKEKFNNNIKFDFEIKNCNEKVINRIKNFSDYLKQIGVETIDVGILHNANAFSVEEINNLLNLQDYLKETWGIEDLQVAEKAKTEYGRKESKDIKGRESLRGDGWYSLSRTIEAHKLMEDEIKKIENLNLSPFEKFLFVHDFVSNRIYKEVGNGIDSFESRNFVAAMTGEYIVCVGYAKILQKFCERLGIEASVLSGNGHSVNVVKIVDKKYGIDGEYFCDACWDHRRLDEFGNIEQEGTRRYYYAALPLQDVQHIGQSRYFADKLKGKESKAIPLTALENALANLYMKLEKENFNWNSITHDIRRSYSQERTTEGDNAFSESVRLANRFDNSYDDFKDHIAEVDNIENNNLGKEEWEFILNRLNETTTDKYKELAEKILYLLDELNGRNLENLIKMLNKNFEFKGNAMDHYEFTCNNKLAPIYVMVKEKLVKKQREIEARIEQRQEINKEKKQQKQEEKKNQQKQSVQEEYLEEDTLGL